MAAKLMQAALIETFGAEFRVVSLARPEPGHGEVLVRLAASAINPLDIKIWQGEAPHARQPLPAVLGMDMAGVVEFVGPDVTGLRRGDEVYGMIGGVGGLQGTLAEFANVDARLLAPKPATLSMREAAALPLAFITAWEGLVDRARIKPGDKVLIQGGAGGVGHIALQIAHSFGTQVYATVSERDRTLVQRWGATAVDRDASPESVVATHTGGVGFDVVFDTVGGAVLDASFHLVRRFGHVVSALGWGTHLLAPLSFRAASYSGVFTLLPLLTAEGRAHHGWIMREATRLAEMGKITPRLDPRRFTLEMASDAYRALQEHDAVGKLVVDIGNATASARHAHQRSKMPVPA